MTKIGRKEASRTTEVAYYLLESMSTQRMTRLLLYSERLKKIGLPSGEVSRIRQYERFLSDMVEQLRMVKMYRSPQALRSFARIFTLLLPPFYAPTFAQVAMEVNSLGVGVAFGIVTALGLTALFESLQVLEDPFTAFLALDGIDVREVRLLFTASTDLSFLISLLTVEIHFGFRLERNLKCFTLPNSSTQGNWRFRMHHHILPLAARP